MDLFLNRPTPYTGVHRPATSKRFPGPLLASLPQKKDHAQRKESQRRALRSIGHSARER